MASVATREIGRVIQLRPSSASSALSEEGGAELSVLLREVRELRQDVHEIKSNIAADSQSPRVTSSLSAAPVPWMRVSDVISSTTNTAQAHGEIILSENLLFYSLPSQSLLHQRLSTGFTTEHQDSSKKEKRVPLHTLLEVLGVVVMTICVLSLISWYLGTFPMVIVNPFVALLTLVASPFIYLMGRSVRPR